MKTLPEVASAPAETPSRTDFPAPKYRRILGVDRSQLLFWATIIILALLVLAPVVPTLYQSVMDRPLYEEGGLFTTENFTRLFTEAGFGSVALNTLMFAVMTTVLTLLIAVPMAIVVVRTNIPGRRFFGAAMQWPFFISSLILGFGWITMYGPAGFASVQVKRILGFLPWDLYTIPGMAITEAVALAPIAYVFCSNALRNSDASLEGAAQTVGAGPFRILWSVIIPMLRPPMVYSSVLVFSMSIETLSIPLLYGQPVGITVFATFLYKNGLQSIDPDYGILGAASVIILLVTILLVAVQAKLLKDAKRFVSVRGKATRPRLLDLGWIKWLSVAFITVYVVIGALVPILGLVMRSFTKVFTPLQNPLLSLTMGNYQRIIEFPVYLASIRNSLIVASVGAVLVSVLAVVAVVVSKRSTFRYRKVIEYLALAPQAMPGLIIGIGLFWAFSFLPFNMGSLVQGTIWAIIIGFGLRALPSAFGSISPAVMQIGEELDNAARVNGADWMRMFLRVLAKLLTPAFVAAMVLTFVVMMKEYSPAIFLGSADTNIIGTTMLELWVQGNTGSVAALATIQIAITAAFVGIAGLLMKGKKDA
ncbi:iron ABC transporter permease [Pseudarthrobacter sulfonivorans]|uniref:ABC transporter permease n=1 Tax=Pseudarthrobacter sulfonivorans TaxID=121292 RepID=UPI00285578C8|nr:iron ABC transporter permease [Pseudarthrobacter sulfonivorans]MDR6417699.1 iron(III) transport system permease protein [Pseudarthrobacter sulfonivorans]